MLCSIISQHGFSQDRPVGYWRSHMPYGTCVSVATDGTKMYVAGSRAFYTLDLVSKETEGFSKVEGMSDLGMSYIGYDRETETAILAYSNSNIDLYKDGSFYNIPDLKLKSATSSKKINHIYTTDGIAYLSTDIGIVVLNLDKKEVKETYSFTINSQNIGISGVTIIGNMIYASTSKGLYRANKNGITLQSFPTWTKLDTLRNLIGIASVQDKVFVTGKDSLFVLESDTLRYLYRSDTNTRHIDAGYGILWISENYKDFTGKIKKLSISTYQFLDSFKISGYPTQVLATDSNKNWIADEIVGLLIQEYGGQPYATDKPEGPNLHTSYGIYASDKDVWVMHGGYDDKQKAYGSGAGFSHFANDKWKIFRQYDYKVFGDTMLDFTEVTKGPEGNLYFGSAQSGLLIQKPDGSIEYYKQNSFIDASSISATWYRIGGFAFDNQNNLWMTVFGGKHELAVRTKEGNYYQFIVPIPRAVIANAATNIIVDDNDQKWYATTGSAGGVIVYNDNQTPDNPNDDTYRQLLRGKGSGGLADNEVYCLAKDKNGAIWIGTKGGISIISCASQVISGGCEAENRIVQYDQFAGYLFQNEVVRTIAVDGANRKWIGTNNGVWLISAEGDKIISRFTEDNSPLPSNFIQKICIDPVTGDVYIGTEGGLISYRGTSTEGGKENKEVKVFPNPVPSGYKGTISIKGLVENADVRITDISGQLIYRTKALGGQAVWDGMDYTNRRPQTGVYLIFITNKDGSQKHVGKMVFME